MVEAIQTVMPPEPQQGEGSARRFWPAVAVAVAFWTGSVLGLIWSNPRLLASWHGFLHAGIASRFPSPTLVPENPFFAGEPLAYYWFYQWCGSALSRVSGIDVLHAFQAIALSSLALLIVAAALAGRRLYRSTGAGLIIGFLALLGMNAFGPAIAAAKYAVADQPLLEHSRPDPDGDIFVTDAQADDRMAKPLLGALNFGTDWRGNQNIVWFFDVSSRAPAIALLMLMAWLFTHSSRGNAPSVALVPVGALTAALNPVIGLSTASALVAAAGIVWIAERRTAPGFRSGNPVLVRSFAFLLGVSAAWPAYGNLFSFGDAVVISLGRAMLIKAVAVVAGFSVLVPLALWGLARGSSEMRSAATAIGGAGLLLIGIVPFVELPEANQHNFLNAASCLLAVPAGAWILGRPGDLGARARVRRRAVVLVLVFAPVTIALVMAFAGRENLPLQFDHGALRRTPEGGALDAFYGWLSSATPRDAVVISDPRHVVKMSGNVSELPAFTGRALFVDQASYMTTPYADYPLRTTIADSAAAGQALNSDQMTYLRALGRPLYLVTFAADEPGMASRLAALYGPPAFRQDFVAAFLVAPR